MCLQYKQPSVHANPVLASGTLLDSYGVNLLSDILNLFLEVFKSTGLEMNRTVFESQLCYLLAL